MIGKPSIYIDGPFSIAMLVYQRVHPRNDQMTSTNYDVNVALQRWMLRSWVVLVPINICFWGLCLAGIKSD